MLANEGIDLSGSLTAGWVGKCSKLLERVSDAIRDPGNAHQLSHVWIVQRETDQRLVQLCEAVIQPVQLIKVAAEQIALCFRQRCFGQPVSPALTEKVAFIFGDQVRMQHRMHTALCPAETAKMNKVNPEAGLAWVLERIQDHPANRINDLMPWAYQDMINAKNAEVEVIDAA